VSKFRLSILGAGAYRELEVFELKALKSFRFSDSRVFLMWLLSLSDLDPTGRKLDMPELVMLLTRLINDCRAFPLEKIQSDGKQAANIAMPDSTIPQ
jgi:hypothetical protein